MANAKLRYPCRVGKTMFDAGTVVEVVQKDDPRVLAVFPGMREKAGSKQVAVVFPGVHHITIASRDQLVMEEA